MNDELKNDSMRLVKPNKEIVYLNAAGIYLTELGKMYNGEDILTPDLYKVVKSPTKCRVIINSNLVAEDVYVWIDTKSSDHFSLYKDYFLIKTGLVTGNELENQAPWGWVKVQPKTLVLDFKSSDYVIESM